MYIIWSLHINAYLVRLARLIHYTFFYCKKKQKTNGQRALVKFNYRFCACKNVQ